MLDVNKIHLTIAALISVIPMFVNGLFYPGDQLLVSSIIFALSLIALIYMAVKKNPIIMRSPIDLALPIFLSLYLLASFWATNAWLNSLEILKYSYLLIVYITIRRACASKDDAISLIKWIFGGTVIVAATGLISTYFTSVNLSDTGICGTMIFPNALGSAALCGIMLGFGLYDTTKHKIGRLFLCLGGYILFTAMMFSGVRIVWAVFFIVWLLFLFFKKNKWERILIYTTVMSIPYLTSAQLFAKSIETHDILGSSLSLILGISITCVIYYSTEKIARLSKQTKQAAALICLCLLLVSVIAVISFPYHLLPSYTADHLSNFSMLEHNATEQITIGSNVFDMVLKSPILGFGGAAWTAAYQTYQTFSYATSRIPYAILQNAAELGFVGATIMLLVMLLTIYTGIRIIRQHGAYLTGVVCAVFGLMLCGLFSSPFDVPAVSVLFWALISIIAAYNSGKRLKITISPYAVILPMAAALIISAMFSSGIRYAGEGERAKAAGNYAGAADMYKQAKALAFNNDEYKLQYLYSKVRSIDENTSSDFTDEFSKTIDGVAKRNLSNPALLKMCGALYAYTGQTIDRIITAEQVVDLQPLDPANYEELAIAYKLYLDKAIEDGNGAEINATISHIVDIPSLSIVKNSDKDEQIVLTEDTMTIVNHARDVYEYIRQQTNNE